MARLIIDGNVAETKARLSDKPLGYDSISYVHNGIIYDAIQDVFRLLLSEKRYEALKDFNECVFLVENATGLLPQRSYYPMHMQIEHTSFCNARCIMCFHYYYHNRTAFRMEEHIYSKCRAWLPFVRLVGLHGFGETFLAPDLPLYLEDYHNYGIKLYTNTNLSVIPACLKNYYSDFQFINISCDGATKEVFEGIRQYISFETFIDNVKRLRMEAPDVELIFAVVLMRQNLHQCEQIVRLAADLGINKVTFSKIGINYVIGNYEDSADRYPETLRRNLQAALETGQKLSVEVVVPCRPQELDAPINSTKLHDEQAMLQKMPFWEHTEEDALVRINGADRTNLQMEKRVSDQCFQPTNRAIKGICDWITNNIYVSAAGRVGFCCSNFKYFIGDLNHEELDDIWKGDNYRRMTEAFRSGKLPYFCRNCNLFEKQMLLGITEIAS